MKKLIQQILSIEKATLTDDQWDILNYLNSIQSIHNQNDLSNILNQYPQFKKSFSSAVLKYLDDWLPAKDSLIEIKDQIEKKWREKTGQAISTDELLSIFIKFLPRDAMLINNVLQKLENFASFDRMGQFGFLITNLECALVYKSEHLEEPEIILDKHSIAIIEEINNEYEKEIKAKIDVLKKSCNEYQDYLSSTIINHCAQDAKLCSLLLNKDIHQLIEDNHFCDKVRNLMYKYVVVGDLLFSLLNERNYFSDRYQAFEAKFKHHYPILEKNNDSYGLFFLKLIAQIMNVQSFIEWCQTKNDFYLSKLNFFNADIDKNYKQNQAPSYFDLRNYLPDKKRWFG